MKRALEMDSGDSCATLWMQWTENLKMVNMVIWCFVHFTTIKKKRETDQEDSHMNREDTQVPYE